MEFWLAMVPVLWLVVGLGVLQKPAAWVCSSGAVISYLLAVTVWEQDALMMGSAALEGALFALWPILLITVGAIFTYKLAVYSGAVDVIKQMLAGISTDRRIQVLILAWGFGGFLESVAGYGTAVAIPLGILISLGFDPFFAAMVSLLANTVAVAFGAVGIPVVTLAELTQMDPMALSFAITQQLGLFVLLLPMLLVSLTGGGPKALKGVFGITLASGLGFLVPQYFITKYLGPELPAVVGSLTSIAVTALLAKTCYKHLSTETQPNSAPPKSFTAAEIWVAWAPYIIVTSLVLLVSPLFPWVYHQMTAFSTSAYIYQGEGAHPMKFKWLASPGIFMLLAAFVGGFIQKVHPKDMGYIFGQTLTQLKSTFVTVISIVALSKLMSHAGMVQSIATTLTSVLGQSYPLFAPMLGTLGTFLTGSDTSSNVLFGQLQLDMAHKLGLNTVWLVASNTSGAALGKMISLQSISVAVGTANMKGSDGKILSSTVGYCSVFVLLVGILVFVGSMLLPA